VSRPAETDAATQRVLAQLERRELLLQAGNEFASVVELVAGEPVRGSWWAHPRANLIYWVCQDLEADARVTEARLLGGKITHIWHTRWADVTSIAIARAPWQWAGVHSDGRALVERVDAADVRTNELDWRHARRLGDVCRLLERRLLVKADEVHTESGRHAKVLHSWTRFWDEHDSGPLPDSESARARLEELVGDASTLLPWVRAG
jgi:hypothetical protein